MSRDIYLNEQQQYDPTLPLGRFLAYEAAVRPWVDTEQIDVDDLFAELRALGATEMEVIVSDFTEHYVELMVADETGPHHLRIYAAT